MQCYFIFISFANKWRLFLVCDTYFLRKVTNEHVLVKELERVRRVKFILWTGEKAYHKE